MNTVIDQDLDKGTNLRSANAAAVASNVPAGNIHTVDIRKTGSPMPLVSGNL